MPQNQTTDCVVIGAGVIGCAVALRLRQAGLQVTLLERGAPGREATWASAGMLSPQAEAEGPGPALDFGMASRDLYPDFAAEIGRLADVDVGYRQSGVIWLALTDEDEARLAQREAWQRRAGLPLERLDARSLHDAEPALTADLRFGLLFPGDHQVDARRLGEGLAEAAARAGVRVVSESRARRLVVEHGRVTAVAAETGTIATPRAVLAAGAWSGEIEGAGLPPGAVRPVRGQIVELDPATPIRRVVFTAVGYLVPKPRGRLLAGSTMEEAGYNKSVTLAGMEAIARGAAEMAPSLAAIPFREAWAGFRPATKDRLPVLGPSPSAPNVFYATGHYRSGILLSAITGELIAGLIAGRKPPVDVAPFSPARFTNRGKI
jgi:glycine oxidase